MSPQSDALRAVELIKLLAEDAVATRALLQELDIADLRGVSDAALRLHEAIEDRLV
ncbi:hypothetical protein OOK36_50875 [Streptomyces sp. NBC_00365]|uniref:hypothetical protein n=1 Tax=Streptomyces sp. NBC_00365 TaxID=2975726 RepID=UPI00225AC4CE|nr:hypothetical protein [Streptomyces sp. NBC_00365]MCX5096879.1 hypothetical protein [Streptomyces sp. NBC_00365]